MNIRKAKPTDAEGILRTHRDAILTKAASHYSPKQLEDWVQNDTPEAISDQAEKLADPNLVVYVAEYNGKIIGFSMIAPANNELRAVYVADNSLGGVGSQLLKAVEAEAIQRQLSHLACDSSMNAESFYKKHGYKTVEYTTHKLRGGTLTPCVKMIKRFLDSF